MKEKETKVETPTTEKEISSQTTLIEEKPKVPKQRNYFWLVLLILFSFYIGVAWGKKQTTKKTQSSTQVSSFLKNLSKKVRR